MKTVLIKANTIVKSTFGGEKYVSGVGRSTYMLLEALSKLPSLPFKVKLYASGINSIFHKNELPFSYHTFPVPQRFGVSAEAVYERNLISHDLLHIPHNFDNVAWNDRFVVTMHDTCLYDISKERGDNAMLHLWEETAKRSKGIITCSESSKNDIIDRFGVKADKISVIPWAVSHNLFKVLSDEIVTECLASLKINSPYFLSVSCSKKRKNILNLLKAYQVLRQMEKDAPKLVLLWNNPPTSILTEFSKEIEEGSVVFLSTVSDNDLVCLYNGAVATLFPSRYEGFGFPILESFACDTPVMTCRNSSLAEVGGDAAYYVGEDDIEEMAHCMLSFIDSTFNEKQNRQQRKEQLAKFSWEKTAQKYVDFYERYL